MSRFVFLLILLAHSLLLSSCLESPVMPGTVARVNGQSIFFADLEARRAALFAGDSESVSKLDDSALAGQYRYALGQLIEEALVTRHMEPFPLEEGALAAEEQRIRGDYPEGAFEQMMLERGLNLERWRADLARALLVERFCLQVLRPEISISADEVQAYYREHSEEFTISEQWHFLHVSAENKKEAESALARLDKGEDAETVQKELLVTIRDVQMAMDLLPRQIVDVLQPLTPGKASRVAGSDKDYWAVRLMEVLPASSLDAAEISKRVETALSEEKMRVVYEAWLNNQLETAEIRITPVLTGRLSGNGESPAALPSGPEGSLEGQSEGPAEAPPAQAPAAPALTGDAGQGGASGPGN